MFRKIIAFTFLLTFFLFPIHSANANETEASCEDKRVIVFVVDNFKFEDVSSDMPNIKKILEKSYVASLSPGRTNMSRDAISFFTTLSAGTRTYDKGETITASPGQKVDLGIDDVISANKSGTYNASIGLLGETLNKNKVSSALIEPSLDHNSFALLSDTKGDARNIFSEAGEDVKRALDKTKKSVLFSHVNNIDAKSTDKKFLEIISQFSNENTEIMILGAHDFNGPDDLEIAAFNTDGKLGTMKSGTRQRDGLIEIVDIAPSILKTLCIDSDIEYEGSFVTFDKSEQSFSQVLDERIGENNRAHLREETSGKTSLLFTTFAVIILALTLAWKFLNKNIKIAAVIKHMSYFCLWVFISTFLINANASANLGQWFIKLILCSTLLYLLGYFVAKKQKDFTLFPTLIVITMFVADAFFNNIFQANAALGYSFITNSRSYGFSNFASAAFSASIIYISYLCSQVNFKYRKTIIALIFLFALAFIGHPKFGADVGGALSSAPAFIAAFFYFTKTRIKIWLVLLSGAICSIGVFILGYLDYQRPKNERTHLGRLFDDVHDNGFKTLYSVVERKSEAMLSTFSSNWLIVAMLFLLCFYLYREALIKDRNLTIPMIILAFFGTFLNDAGVLVGATVILLSFCIAANMHKSKVDKKLLN